ncbi:hypothetical protein [Spirosoma daeguense]
MPESISVRYYKTIHFKRLVVEVYRAKIARPAHIQQYLHIALTEGC